MVAEPDPLLEHAAMTLDRVQGLQWMSDGFDAKNGPLVMPLEQQFYIGFYSKKAFTKAGITSPPTTWDEKTNVMADWELAFTKQPAVKPADIDATRAELKHKFLDAKTTEFVLPVSKIVDLAVHVVSISRLGRCAPRDCKYQVKSLRRAFAVSRAGGPRRR